MYILVVEDDPSIREILALIADAAFPGASVATAQSGLEAFEACRNRLPDLLLLDLGLPDMTGFDVLTRLNEMGRSGKVVVVTAEDRAEKRARAMSLGASAFVAKPFDGRQLRDLLRRVAGETAASGDSDSRLAVLV